jgi:hypothetical protein
MRVLSFAFLRIRALIRAKLGVCPRCMRASALGSVLSWALVAGLGAFTATPWLLLPALIVAIAFSALIAAHLVAYMIRTGRALCHRERAARAMHDPAHALTRRAFAGVVLRAGAWAALAAFLGPLAARAQANLCAGKQEPNPRRTEFGVGNTKAEALQRAQQKAEDYCALLCEDLPCGAAGGCVRDGPVVVTVLSLEPGALAPWDCEVEVKQCNCGCRKCSGTHGPLFYSENAWGLGTTEAEARSDLQTNAGKMCDKVCARNTDCIGPKTCKRVGSPRLAEAKAWKHASNIWEASAKLLSCNCDCQ